MLTPRTEFNELVIKLTEFTQDRLNQDKLAAAHSAIDAYQALFEESDIDQMV